MKPPTTRNSEQARARQMREQGYSDGRAGMPARWKDADYQRSWRLGRKERDRHASESR